MYKKTMAHKKKADHAIEKMMKKLNRMLLCIGLAFTYCLSCAGDIIWLNSPNCATVPEQVQHPDYHSLCKRMVINMRQSEVLKGFAKLAKLYTSIK